VLTADGVVRPAGDAPLLPGGSPELTAEQLAALERIAARYRLQTETDGVTARLRIPLRQLGAVWSELHAAGFARGQAIGVEGGDFAVEVGGVRAAPPEPAFAPGPDRRVVVEALDVAGPVALAIVGAGLWAWWRSRRKTRRRRRRGRR